MTTFPLWLPDGSEAETLGQVAALLGCSTKRAAHLVLESVTASEDLMTEAKDVFGGSASSSVGIGVGTVLGTLGTIERPKRKRKRRRKKDSEDKAVAVVCPECGKKYWVDDLDEIEDHKEKCKGRENKALHDDPQADTYDNTVCVMLEVFGKQGLAWPGGLKPDKLHITLGYYGNIDSVGNDKIANSEDDWEEEIMSIARETDYFFARVGGITRFSGMPDKDNPDKPVLDPIVLNMDAPELEDLRRKMIDRLGKPNSEHGFTPHMTLGYIDEDDPMPIQRYPLTPVAITAITLAWGKNYYTYNLKGWESKSMFESLAERAGGIAGIETKGVRHVRTPAGARRFGQPIGSVIVRDSPLKNLTSVASDWEGWNKYKGANGKEYLVGKYDGDKKWSVTHGDSDDVFFTALSEEDALRQLDERSAGRSVKPKGKPITKTPKKPTPSRRSAKDQKEHLSANLVGATGADSKSSSEAYWREVLGNLTTDADFAHVRSELQEYIDRNPGTSRLAKRAKAFLADLDRRTNSGPKITKPRAAKLPEGTTRVRNVPKKGRTTPERTPMPETPRGFKRIPRGYEATVNGDHVTIKKSGSKWKVTYPEYDPGEWDKTFDSLDDSLKYVKGGWESEADPEGSATVNTSTNKKFDKARNVAWRLDPGRHANMEAMEKNGKGHWRTTKNSDNVNISEFVDNSDGSVLFHSAGGNSGSFTQRGKGVLQPAGTGRAGTTGRTVQGASRASERPATPQDRDNIPAPREGGNPNARIPWNRLDAGEQDRFQKRATKFYNALKKRHEGDAPLGPGQGRTPYGQFLDDLTAWRHGVMSNNVFAEKLKMLRASGTMTPTMMSDLKDLIRTLEHPKMQGKTLFEDAIEMKMFGSGLFNKRVLVPEGF